METSDSIVMDLNNCILPTNAWDMLAPNTNQKYQTMYNLFMKWITERGLESTFSESVLAMYLNDQAKKLSPDHLKNTYAVLRSTLLIYHNIDIAKFKELGMLIERCHYICSTRRNKSKTIVEDFDVNNALNGERIYIKYCFVPSCDNNSKSYKCQKIFIRVPENREIRKRWYDAVYDRYDKETPKSTMLFCCEDHFDLETDAKNYMRYKTMGSCKLFMREDIVPHKNLGKKVSVSAQPLMYPENMLVVSLETEPQLCFDECGANNDEEIILPDFNYQFDRRIAKYCFVPSCVNNSKFNPEMVFVRVPEKKEVRIRWFSAIFGHYVDDVPKTTMLYCCEDHFDLEKDAKNYMWYKTMGSSKLYMKEDVVPHKNMGGIKYEVDESQTTSEDMVTVKTENPTTEESASQDIAVAEPTTTVATQRNNNELCVVPNCPNSSATTPDKVFIPVPKNYRVRKDWIYTIGRGSREMAKNLDLYVCEDHFDLENDLENYMMLKIMSWKGKKVIKKGILPHKFEHVQIERQGRFRPAILYRRRKRKPKKAPKSKKQDQSQLNCKFEEVFIQEEHFEETEDVGSPIKEEIEDDVNCCANTRLANGTTEHNSYSTINEVNTETVYIKQEELDSDMDSYNVSDNNEMFNKNSAPSFEHINMEEDLVDTDSIDNELYKSLVHNIKPEEY